MLNIDYWLVAIIILLILTGVAGLYMVFYKRPTKETAYVRTGAGGEVVFMDSGGFVFPVIHEAIAVRMNTQKIEIHRNEEHALITKDGLRVDVTAEFHLRVKAEEKSISVAARTLGEKSLNPELLKGQVEGLCVGALRSVAAEMDMVELHEQRREFEHKVERNISNVLLEMGLELVSVSMTALDQTELRYFDTDNALNVKGIDYIKKRMADSEKQQTAIEQEKEVFIREKEVAAQEKKLRLELEEANLEQQQQLEIAQKEYQTELDMQKAKTNKEIALIELDRKEKITMALAQRSVAKAWIETDKYKAVAASASEKIGTAREKEQAERNKLIEVISAAKEAEKNRIISEGSRDADLMEAEAAKIRYTVEAAGKEALNKAANLLSNDQISLQIKQEIVRQLPDIIRESAKPIESIDGINIMHVDGLAGGGGKGSAGGQVSSGNLGDQIVDSALRYKAQAPLVDSLLKQIGIDGSGIKQMTEHLQDDLAINKDSKDKSNNGNADKPETPSHHPDDIDKPSSEDQAIMLQDESSTSTQADDEHNPDESPDKQ
jgi:uncharacterized membrane protein YqiK